MFFLLIVIDECFENGIKWNAERLPSP